MLLIRCPWCGARPHSEFAYGGDAKVVRPPSPETATDAEWFDYLYIRDNPKGPHAEYWQHIGGCRQWIKVLRDTVTNEVLATTSPGEPPEEGRR